MKSKSTTLRGLVQFENPIKHMNEMNSKLQDFLLFFFFILYIFCLIKEKVKERVLFTLYIIDFICPGGVAAYHPSLSSSGPGFKFRPGRFIFFLKLECFTQLIV